MWGGGSQRPVEFCFEMTPVWVGQRNLFSAATLPHTPSPIPPIPFLKCPLPQSYFATIKVLGRFLSPQKRPARSGHIVNLCVASFLLGSWNGWAADSLVGLPQGQRKKPGCRQPQPRNGAAEASLAGVTQCLLQKPAVHFLMPPLSSQCHCRESTPGRPSEALPRKTRSFLTETLSQCLSWKRTTPAMPLHLSTTLPLTGNLASSSPFLACG